MAPLVLIWRRVASNLEAIWVRITNPRISRVIGQDIALIRSFFMILPYLGICLLIMRAGCVLFLRSPTGRGRVSSSGGVFSFRFHVLRGLVFAASSFSKLASALI